jgi:DNA-binding response OmpR family regulator
MKILLADMDADVLDLTTYALRRYGFDVVGVKDGLHALQCWKETAPDLVLAEGDLPGLNGFDLCREIRQHSSTPVIILSERRDDVDVIRGFQFGADDYVMKPFSHRQLAMRIRAVLSRTAGMSSEAAPRAELRAGDLYLDLESHEVSRGGQTVRLTPIEFRILYLLMLSPGRVVSNARLIEHAWGYGGADAVALKMHISRIRQKLARRNASFGTIRSVRWVGYMLQEAQ